MDENQTPKQGGKLFFLTLILVLAGGTYFYYQYSCVKVNVIRHGLLQSLPRTAQDMALLSPDGIQQANELGDVLKGKGIRVVYSSAVEHDRTMASVVAAKVDATMTVDYRIGNASSAGTIGSKSTSIGQSDEKQDSGTAGTPVKPGFMDFFGTYAKFGVGEIYMVAQDDVIKGMYEATHASKDPSSVGPASISTFAYNVFTNKLSFEKYEDFGALKARGTPRETASTTHGAVAVANKTAERDAPTTHKDTAVATTAHSTQGVDAKSGHAAGHADVAKARAGDGSTSGSTATADDGKQAVDSTSHGGGSTDKVTGGAAAVAAKSTSSAAVAEKGSDGTAPAVVSAAPSATQSTQQNEEQKAKDDVKNSRVSTAENGNGGPGKDIKDSTKDVKNTNGGKGTL